MRFNSLNEWLSWLESFHPKEIDLGLERVKTVYERLNPGQSKPYTITIAGTNGKGSCVAMLSSIFRSQGYRVGTYTSPHFLRYNERICIQDIEASDQQVCDAFDRVDQARDDTSLTYFEFGTLAALDIFSRSKIDVQLLEVGLGGRLDAVNIVDADLAVVTGIAIDHSDWLGDSREAIGLEKAGIFRPEVAAVIGDSDPPNSLIKYARENNVPLFQKGREFRFHLTERGWDWYDENHALKDLPPPNLKGRQQLGNAAVVLQSVILATDTLPVFEDAIRRGFKEVRLAGRFQLISKASPEVLLDVAHNRQSAEALADNLRQIFRGRRLRAVFSVMKDKDIEGVLAPMKSVIDRWYISPLEMARAASVSALVERFRMCSISEFEYGFSNFQETYETAKNNCEEMDLVVIFGSFYLVAKYLEYVES